MPAVGQRLARRSRAVARQFEQLSRSVPRLLEAVVVSREKATPMTKRRRPRLSPAQRRALKLQGKYMGTMRGLLPRQRSRVKRARAQSGIRAAIALAQSLY